MFPEPRSWNGDRDDPYAGRDHELEQEARERWEQDQLDQFDRTPLPQGDGDPGDDDPGDCAP